jgi:hypothetical protein
MREVKHSQVAKNKDARNQDHAKIKPNKKQIHADTSTVRALI